MEIVYSKLFKIDREVEENNVEELFFLANNESLKEYIITLIESLNNRGIIRSYDFRATETTVKNWLEDIVQNSGNDEVAYLLATRLYEKELVAQSHVERMNVDVQKGAFMIAYVQMTEDEYKIILIKADYYTILSEAGDLQHGIPWKKKIFKAFIANVTGSELSNMTCFDTKPKVAEYWWKDFMGLEQLLADDVNTERAYTAIKAVLYNNIKKVSKEDYYNLNNDTIAFFHQNNNFDYNDYLRIVIYEYTPTSGDIKMDNLKNKLIDLPERKHFDRTFNTVKSKVSRISKQKYELTSSIELSVTNGCANNTIQRTKKADGSNWVMIKSDDNYEYFPLVEYGD